MQRILAHIPQCVTKIFYDMYTSFIGHTRGNMSQNSLHKMPCSDIAEE